MNIRRIGLALLALGMATLACQTIIPAKKAPAAGPTSRAEATAFAPDQGFTLVRIYAKDGDLHSQLAAEVKKAQALGQSPFVEFDASWCGPCQAITAGLAARNPLMTKAYSGIYLVHADVDEWGWYNFAAGFPQVKAIPIFFALGSDGRPSGAVVDGGAWQADIPENIAPVLTNFFHK